MNIYENTTKSSEIIGVDNPTCDSYESSRTYSNGNSVAINGLSDGLVSQIAAMRQMSAIAQPVSMSWHNIDVFSKDSSNFSFPFKKKKEKPVVHILKNGNHFLKTIFSNKLLIKLYMKKQ
jgi:hypothetical protein